MQESVSMFKSHTPVKQGRRKKKRRGRETGKTEARRLMERKAAQQNKNLSEELKQGLSMPKRIQASVFLHKIIFIFNIKFGRQILRQKD